MPKGRTGSSYSLQERRRLAFGYFTKGYTNEQIAKLLHVHKGTVAQYRQQYEDEISDQVQLNPNLLRDVLRNTVTALTELDEVRRSAWREYEEASEDVIVTCPCGCEHEFVALRAASISTRNQLLKTITGAQEQRGKLLGLFGVKAEFLHHVNQVRFVQERLLAFMKQSLCATDKALLEQMMVTEFGDMMGSIQKVPALPELGPGE